jgi:hypothetical protein
MTSPSLQYTLLILLFSASNFKFHLEGYQFLIFYVCFRVVLFPIIFPSYSLVSFHFLIPVQSI